MKIRKVIPFLFMQDARLALRVSNVVAIAMLFGAGCLLASYAGMRRIRTGLAIVLAAVSRGRSVGAGSLLKCSRTRSKSVGCKAVATGAGRASAMMRCACVGSVALCTLRRFVALRPCSVRQLKR